MAAKFKSLRRVLDEQARRLWAVTEARALGYGGVSAVARATIAAGLAELEQAVTSELWPRN
jgi:hypothetical protein